MKNINILKDLNTLNKLHTSSVESYTTNNGIVDFTCENAGYVDNVVIEGKTLVNLIRTNLSVEVWDNNRVAINLQDCNYLEGTYTLFNFSDKTIVLDIGEATTNNWLRTFALEKNKVKTFNIHNGERIFNVNGLLADGWENNDTSKNEFRNSIVLLEGNHTDKPISYFEGLKSVGQGDSIEIATYQKDKESELDFTFERAEANLGDGVFTPNNTTTNAGTSFIYVCGGKVRLSRNGHICLYDENFKFIRTIKEAGTDIVNVNEATYIRIWYAEYDMEIKIYHTPYLDKKQISTTLRSLPNGVKDTIEKRGNKYVKVQMCGEVVLDGNVDVTDVYKPNHGTSLNYHRFLVRVVETPNYGDVFCDRLGNVGDYEIEKDNILGDKPHSGFFVTLHNDKTGGTREGFKTWLQANPLTVVYELATPQIIELPNFNSQTYKGENTLIVNSGVIQCDASFDVCEGIRSELDVIKDKVSSLYDDYIVDIPIQYLNGWEGSLTCRVNGKCVTLAGMLHGQDVAIKSARTNILKLPINSKAINITTIGLYNVFGQYVGTVELTLDNEIKICHSDFTYNGNYIGLNLSWFLH